MPRLDNAKDAVLLAAFCAMSPALCLLGSIGGCGSYDPQEDDEIFGSISPTLRCYPKDFRKEHDGGDSFIYMPVVIHHFVQNSSYFGWAEARSKIDALNIAFGPAKIKFYLRDVNAITDDVPNGLRNISGYLYDGPLNIFFFGPSDAGFGDGNLLPNGAGFFISPNGSPAIWAHNMGHLLGLNNTNMGGDELVDKSNCENSGDNLCDTPADPGSGEGGCSYDAETCTVINCPRDANGDQFQPDGKNYMNEYADECLDHFSEEQQDVMRCSALTLFSNITPPEDDAPNFLTVGCVGEDVINRKTIRSAAEEIATGGVIEVCSGGYTEHIDLVGATAKMTIRARAGEKVTIFGKVDGKKEGPTIVVTDGADLKLEGIQVRLGAADRGGGILVENSSIELKNSSVNSCEGKTVGGALYAFSSLVNWEGGVVDGDGPGTVAIENSTQIVFKGVTFLGGGATLQIDKGSANIDNCTFGDDVLNRTGGLTAKTAQLNISDTSFYFGDPAISLDNAEIHANGLAVIDSTARQGEAIISLDNGSVLDGTGFDLSSNTTLSGGIFFYLNNASSFRGENVAVFNNNASEHGSRLFVVAGNSNISITEARFENNTMLFGCDVDLSSGVLDLISSQWGAVERDTSCDISVGENNYWIGDFDQNTECSSESGVCAPME